LIRSFLKTGWAEQIEETSLVKLDKSFILPDFRHKEADLVYQATLGNRSMVFYLLMELQSTVDFLMPFRLHQYLSALWCDVFQNTDRKIRERKSFRLPMVVPVVLYNGRSPWTAPLNFREMLEGYETFGEEAPNFPYRLIDVQNYRLEDLLARSNLISSVFLLDQVSDFSQIIQRMNLLLDTLRHLSEEDFQLFTGWTQRILTRNMTPRQHDQITQVFTNTRPEEVDSMISNVERVLKKTYEEAEKKGKKEGMEEGKKEGMEQARQAMARQMIAKNFALSDIAELTGLDREKVEGLHNQD